MGDTGACTVAAADTEECTVVIVEDIVAIVEDIVAIVEDIEAIVEDIVATVITDPMVIMVITGHTSSHH